MSVPLCNVGHMDDDGAAPSGERVTLAVGSVPAGALTVAALESWRAVLSEVDRTMSDAERVDLVRALEELKSAACAAQARLSVDLDASQRAEQARAGVPLSRRGVGIGAQVALARRESP